MMKTAYCISLICAALICVTLSICIAFGFLFAIGDFDPSDNYLTIFTAVLIGCLAAMVWMRKRPEDMNATAREMVEISVFKLSDIGPWIFAILAFALFKFALSLF